jgi:hypothetical protein
MMWMPINLKRVRPTEEEKGLITLKHQITVSDAAKHKKSHPSIDEWLNIIAIL